MVGKFCVPCQIQTRSLFRLVPAATEAEQDRLCLSRPPQEEGQLNFEDKVSNFRATSSNILDTFNSTTEAKRKTDVFQGDFERKLCI